MTSPMFSIRRATRAIGLAFAAGMFTLAPAAWAQKAYPSPDAAAAALVEGVASQDETALSTVLGSDWRKYLPKGGVAMSDVFDFLDAWAKSHRIIPAGDDRAHLEVGRNGWTLPIPIVKSSAGWRFDTKGTPDELRTRRIGRNELDVVQVLLAYTDAQQDYAANDRDRDGQKQYARKLISAPGKRDGLYWPTLEGEAPSPLGPIIADTKPDQAYHGYRYRILSAQGSHAPDGAKDYVQGGRMTGGYAMVAWPASYGETGVMSFIVSSAGQVYQKNLGPKTDAAARAMTRFDPDPSWEKTAP